jgi:hypothetical protein
VKVENTVNVTYIGQLVLHLNYCLSSTVEILLTSVTFISQYTRSTICPPELYANNIGRF